LRVAAGGALFFIGVGLIAAVARGPQQGRDVPYVRRAVAVSAEKVTALAALKSGAAIESFDIAVPGASDPAATGSIIRLTDGTAALLAWQSGISEPVLHPEISPDEERRLMQALQKHLPKNALLFAMPDASRRIHAFLDVEAPLAAADDTDMLLVPSPWRNALELIKADERHFSGLTNGARLEMLDAFLDALLAEDRYGIAKLQVLAKGKESYVVVHARDAFSIGVARPDRLAVGMRDFPGGSQIHDVLKAVREWLKEHRYAAYIAMAKSPEVTRVFFLPEAKDKSILLARLLPFNTNDLDGLPAAQLVYQHQGYWVYRILPVAQ
jgi:hydroxylamine oxidation protein HaoB